MKMILPGYLILMEMVRWISKSSSWRSTLHSAKTNDKSLSGHSGIKSLYSQHVWEKHEVKFLHPNSWIHKQSCASHFYRTKVYLGSDLWVQVSLTNKLSQLLQT